MSNINLINYLFQKEEAEDWVRDMKAGMELSSKVIVICTMESQWIQALKDADTQNYQEGKEGWVLKKYVGERKVHRRYLVLQQGDHRLSYYDTNHVWTIVSWTNNISI